MYMQRCDWGNVSEKMICYHDNEWGIPVHDDRKQFEYLMLEVMQCGLSWNLMIEKREIFRSCFDDFDYEKIAKYTEQDVERILAYPGMIRSIGKVKAVINNAKCFLSIREEFGSFDDYLWSYSSGKTILYMGHQRGNIPSQNGLSNRISKDLKKRGFKYTGPVVVYSHLQACGMINDHSESCFRYCFINDNFDTVKKRRDKEQ
jgi:DNA-3-methyladenine glycosylase I